MEELNLPYKLSVKQGDMTDTLDDAETLPMKMAPAVAVDDKVLIESGFIMEYILARYGKGRLVPKEDSPESWRYRLYMQFADGSAIPRVIPDYASKRAGQIFPSVYGSPDNLSRLLAFLEVELKERTYLAGREFTAADIMMSYPLKLALAIVDSKKYPSVESYYARITAREAYRRAQLASARDAR
jgi:glutathione S-transferase